MPSPLDLVIFDNDGVLVDSEGLANQVLADLLTSYGYPVTRDESVRRFMGTTMAGVRATVEDATGAPLPADFEQRYHDGLFAGFRSGLQPVPGVVAVLDDLERRSVPYCVASSGTHERIRLSLSIVGLLDRFGDRIFSADDVARGKPAPDLFLHAAARSSTRPERCVVVEDSPAGVAAARAAGMRVVGYAAMTPAERLSGADTGADIDAGADAGTNTDLDVGAGADAVITSMAELPAALGLAGTCVPGGGQTGV